MAERKYVQGVYEYRGGPRDPKTVWYNAENGNFYYAGWDLGLVPISRNEIKHYDLELYDYILHDRIGKLLVDETKLRGK